MHPMSEKAQDLKLRNDFALLIDGELINSRQSLEVINPATEKIFATLFTMAILGIVVKFSMDFNRYLKIIPDTEIGATFQE